MYRKLFTKKLLLFGGAIVLFSLPNCVFGQTIARQSISSYGATSLTGGVTLSQTAGQSYSTSTGNKVNPTVNQGFQQPGTFVIEKVKYDLPGELDIKIFPNPSSSKVFINSTKELGNCSIKIVNYQGRCLISEKVTQFTNYQLNCETWVNGIYIITITDMNNNTQTSQLIISK